MLFYQSVVTFMSDKEEFRGRYRKVGTVGEDLQGITLT